MRYRVVFFGTPDFAVPSLAALIDGLDEVVGVVCQADRPACRGNVLRAPAVKQLALRHGLPVAQPHKLRSGAFPERLRRWAPELIVVAAYGRILPASILELPDKGCINVHASLLPKYRGAAPIQWAIAAGETQTGVTIMQMNEQMDAGDILAQRRVAIASDDTAGTLFPKLAHTGAETLLDTMTEMHAGTSHPTPQEESQATYAPLLRKSDGEIDWTQAARDIANRVRAFNPWPSSFTHIATKMLKVHRAGAREEEVAAKPGTVVALGETIDIATGSGVLEIRELQMESRKRVRAAELAHSATLRVGDRLVGDGS